MNQFLPEGLYPQPEEYTREDLLLAMQQRKILQAAAIKCDERHNLHVALGCCKGIIPRAEAARGILGGETRDIAILSRVGRPICFTVMGFAPDGTALLSRRSAQEAALEQIFRENRPGDILAHPDCLDCGISVYPGLHIRAICCGSGSGCLF